jgi:allophanate hydrolase
MASRLQSRQATGSSSAGHERACAHISPWTAVFSTRRRPRSRAALERGDLLAADAAAGGARAAGSSGTAAAVGPFTLRAIPGPHAAMFTAASLDAFFEREWRVSPQSDRRGLRLEGAPLEHVHAAEVDPVGAAPGSVQVPGGGLPIVLGPDGPVTGGYPRIATVIGADLHRLGQAAPGDAVRFVPATLEDALAAYLADAPAAAPGSTISSFRR